MISPSRLTDTATLARSTLWNLAGRLLPLLVAVAATPLLLDRLGLARWGIFALALSLVGLFGMFDLGIGRALTRIVAARLAAGTAQAAASAVATGLALLTGLGVLAGVAAAAGAWAYADLLDLPAALRAEVRWALLALSVAAPLVLVNAALWGVLAAHQRFAAANLANLPILALYYLGPLAALAAWDHLAAATIVLVACRVVMTWAYWRLCRAALPALATARPDWSIAQELLRQGGWITLSNTLQPVAQHLDRFIIAARLSAEAVAHYATPFDIVIRIAVLAQAVLAGAFPAIATALAGPHQEAGRLVRHSLLAILGLVLPPCLVCLLFADLLLGWWLGPEFAAAAATPARWLAAGIVLFALDGVAAALIDGAGHARRNALLALAELALYLPCLFLALDTLGIAGAAMVWTLRALVVAAVRLALATGIHAKLAAELRALAPAFAATLATLAAALTLTLADPMLRLAALPFLTLAPALLAWRHALTPAERAGLAARVAPRRRPR
jgi:O-antigen/teichoic acid export membrane protein